MSDSNSTEFLWELIRHLPADGHTPAGDVTIQFRATRSEAVKRAKNILITGIQDGCRLIQYAAFDAVEFSTTTELEKWDDESRRIDY